MENSERTKEKRARPIVSPEGAARMAAAHTKRSPEREALVLKGMRLGQSIEQAALMAGVTRDTVKNWRAADPVFDAACAGARAELEARMLANIEIAAKDPKTWAAAAWKLERIFPDRYGRSTKMEVTGKGGGPIKVMTDVRTMSDEELMKIASGETVVTYEHED